MDGSIPPELRRALDGWRMPAARPEVRDALRARFVHGAQGDADPQLAEPGLVAALDAYAPRPSEEFRSRLQKRFVSGRLAARTTASTRSPRTRARRGHSAPRAARAERRRFHLVVGGALGVLAAAAVVVLTLMRPDRLWRVDPLEFVAAGLVIDGEPVAGNADHEAVARLLESARTIETGENPVRLVYGDVVVIELGEGTELDLSGMPDDPTGDLRLAGSRGGVRMATGPGFRGPEQALEFHTDRVEVRVTGTVFAVDIYPEVTCVCCCRGEVRTKASDPGIAPGVVGEHWTQFIQDGGSSEFQKDFEPHQAPLERLAGFWR